MTNRNSKNSKSPEIKKIMENFNLYRILTAQYLNNNKNSKSRIIKPVKLLIQSLLLTLMLFSTAETNSQDLADKFSEMIVDSSMKYTQVLTNSISSGLNSGMYQVTKSSNKFSIYLGVKASATFLNTDESLPGAASDIPAIPFAMVQLGIGSIVGTDAMFRYLPKIDLRGYASVSAWGTGIQHCLAKDFRMPIDIRFGAFIHSLNIKDSKGNDLMTMNSWSVNTTISKTFGIFTLYSSFQYENSNSKISYIVDRKVNISGYDVPVRINVNYSQESNNNIRGIAGFNLKMGPVNLNADYNFGKKSAVSIGLGFGF